MSAELNVAEMVAVLSHDLRNPLTVIQTSAKFLSQYVVPDIDDRRMEREYLDVIDRSAERMNHLIRDLLDVSTAQFGRFTIARVPQSAAALIDDALRALEPVAAGKCVELRAECASGLPDLSADHARLMQVLVNIGENAIKFSPRGGQVTIHAATVAGAVRFEISDAGPGIAASHLHRVFDRFWQAADTAHLGNGLGLAIAKTIVEAHAGTIGVTSQPGRGSTFYFNIPTSTQRAMGNRSRESSVAEREAGLAKLSPA